MRDAAESGHVDVVMLNTTQFDGFVRAGSIRAKWQQTRYEFVLLLCSGTTFLVAETKQKSVTS